MIYRIFHPIPLLSEIIEYYWFAKDSCAKSVVQHYATPLLQGLVFNLNQETEQHCYHEKTHYLNASAYIFGQPTSTRTVTSDKDGIDIIGVKFRPLGIYKLTGIKMEYIADQIINASDIWGNELLTLCNKMREEASIENQLVLLETFLTNKYLRQKKHYKLQSMEAALQLIASSKGTIAIKEIQVQINTSRKTLERTFTELIGLTPKLYNRIIRFNATKSIMDHALKTSPKTSNLAIEHGYYDASHFVAEFKHFSGQTPQDYLKSTHQQIVFKDL